MAPLHDLTLPMPLPDAAQRGLLFGTFVFHLLFVLLMLGTAMLAMSYFIHAWWHDRLEELRWDKSILRMFLAHKSLAVVLGVGPLLLIQVGFTIPFFTAVVLLAPFWLLIIGFLIVSFICFDSLGHRIHTHRYIHLGFGIVAMTTLLCVPGFFVAILVATENPHQWMDILRTGFSFDWRLTVHWIFRYLHILGAALVFGGAFHYFFTARHYPKVRPSLLQWMLLGLVLQVVFGMALYWSLLQESTAALYVYLAIGISLTAVMIWLVATRMGSPNPVNHRAVIPILLVLLVAMLLARQDLQDRAVSPFLVEARQAAAAYQAKLQPHEDTALAHYQKRMSVIYNTGPTIYAESCAFCHGANAGGDGPDARYLNVPPEDLSAIRAQRSYVTRILNEGVPGSAMPRFTYYEPQRRDQVLRYLNDKYGIFSLPQRPAGPISSEARQNATQQWSTVCSRCHGEDGQGTSFSAGLRPPPPDLTKYSLTPERIRYVIANGYPGTAMPSFSSFSDQELDALADHVVGLRLEGGPAASHPPVTGGPAPAILAPSLSSSQLLARARSIVRRDVRLEEAFVELGVPLKIFHDPLLRSHLALEHVQLVVLDPHRQIGLDVHPKAPDDVLAGHLPQLALDALRSPAVDRSAPQPGVFGGQHLPEPRPWVHLTSPGSFWL